MQLLYMKNHLFCDKIDSNVDEMKIIFVNENNVQRKTKISIEDVS